MTVAMTRCVIGRPGHPGPGAGAGAGAGAGP